MSKNTTEKTLKPFLPKIQISRDFYHKPSTRRWLQANGAEGVIILQVILIASGQEQGAKIHKDDLAYLQYPLPFSAELINTVIESCVKVGLLIYDGEFYFNEDIISDQINFLKKQKNYSSAAHEREEEKRRLAEQKQDCTKIVAESCQDSGRIIVNMNSEYDPDHDPDLNPKEGGQGETKPTQSSIVQNKPPKIQFGEHVYLTQTEIDNYQNKYGTEFLDRCCEKLNAWIEQDPTAKRVKNGKNAGATFRAWVFNAVAEEQMRATRSPPQKEKLSTAQKTWAAYKEIEAEELEKMRMEKEYE